VNPRAFVDQRFIDMLPEDKYGKKGSLQVLGCDPDFNVYSLDVPDKPDPKTHNFRTSGGHIHLGVGHAFVHDHTAVTYLGALLDQTLGAIGTALCDSKEAAQRLEQYGWAGMVRTNKKIGTLEYRTLPAQALVQTPELALLMFSAAQAVGSFASSLFNESQPAFIDAASAIVGS